MIFEEISKYKSWGGLRKRMEGLLCDSLKGKITYFYTCYNNNKGSFGRAAINYEKDELISFSWDVGIDIQWSDEYQEALKDEECSQKVIHERLMQEKWMPEGSLCHQDFLTAATAYLNTDIASALNSDNYLLRVFAYLDRRVGKRTLLKIKDDTEALPHWAKQFYHFRCKAEGL